MHTGSLLLNISLRDNTSLISVTLYVSLFGQDISQIISLFFINFLLDSSIFDALLYSFSSIIIIKHHTVDQRNSKRKVNPASNMKVDGNTRHTNLIASNALSTLGLWVLGGEMEMSGE